MLHKKWINNRAFRKISVVFRFSWIIPSVVTFEINIAYLAEIYIYQDRGWAFGDLGDVLENRYIYPEIYPRFSHSYSAWHREIDGERSPEPEAGGRRTRSRKLTTNRRISRAALFSSLSSSLVFCLIFVFFLFYKRWRARKESCLRTYFSRWFAGFVALSPRTTVRSAFLLAAGLLELKSDATASLFRPVLDADLVDVGAAAVAAGSAGFALKFALIVCD